jgi:hypothetical protein
VLLPQFSVIFPTTKISVERHPLLPHVNDTTNTISLLHCLKSRIDLWKRLTVSDKLIDLELALHVIVNQVGELSAALNSAKSTPLEKRIVRKCFSITRKESSDLPSKHGQ